MEIVMAIIKRNRNVEGEMHRNPDLFLSHGSGDKEFVRRLADDLLFCEVDVWIDVWELQVGDSLHELISKALEFSRFIAVVIGDNFDTSRWAMDEFKQALARERREKRPVILPLVCGEKEMIPSFLEDKVYISFRRDYFHGVFRLASFVHGVDGKHVEEALSTIRVQSIRDVIEALRFVGIEPYVVIPKADFETIKAAGGTPNGDRINFSPKDVARHPQATPRLRRLMKRLVDEVW
jgi:hypothetical protein